MTITNVCVSTVFLCYDQMVCRHYTIHMTVSPSALSLSFYFAASIIPPLFVQTALWFRNPWFESTLNIHRTRGTIAGTGVRDGTPII